METVTVPKTEFEIMQQELKTLRKTNIYLRLLDFEENTLKDKKYTRKDLGF